MKSTFRAPGACGELVQGTINNINFLITCPINIFSYVTVELNKQDFITINDPKRKKVIKAVNSTMYHILGKRHGATITVNSEIPIGKGLASSTADITADCMATAHVLNYKISYEEIAKIALSIEPTDGLFYPGIVAFDHVKGNYYQKIGDAIPIDILIFDFGGTVDTIAFNQRKDLGEKNQSNEKQIKHAYELIRKGLMDKNPALVGEGATISSLLNQSILYKPHLEDIADLVINLGALGINVAHSGTIFGILLEKEKVNPKEITSRIQGKYPSLKYLGEYTLIDGGIERELEEETLWSKSENMAAT